MSGRAERTTRASAVRNSLNTVGVRLRISSLRLLLRIIATKWLQRVIFRPLMYVMFAWLMWKLMRDPDAFAGIGDGQAAAQAKTLRAQLETQIDRDPGPTSREVGLAMTWGTGGVAVVLLTTTVAIHAVSLSAKIGSACFAISIPVFAVCGAMHAQFTDPKANTPTVGDSLRLTGLMYSAHLALCAGLAAFLWSYTPAVSIAFLVACYFALRFFNRMVARQFNRKISQ